MSPDTRVNPFLAKRFAITETAAGAPILVHRDTLRGAFADATTATRSPPR